jgi:hypothetical protein
MDTIRSADQIAASIGASMKTKLDSQFPPQPAEIERRRLALANRTRECAASALGEIGDPVALPVLRELLALHAPFERGNWIVEQAIRNLTVHELQPRR